MDLGTSHSWKGLVSFLLIKLSVEREKESEKKLIKSIVAVEALLRQVVLFLNTAQDRPLVLVSSLTTCTPTPTAQELSVRLHLARWHRGGRQVSWLIVIGRVLITCFFAVVHVALQRAECGIQVMEIQFIELEL